MPLTIDRTVHYMRIECDGKPTPLHCEVAMEVRLESREACSMAIFNAGWRLDGKRTLCRVCVKREAPARAKRRERSAGGPR
jgi:hypothetical protein